MVASPAKNISRKLAGIISVGIWIPMRLLIQMALETPSMALMSLMRLLVYPAGIFSTMSILVAAILNGSSSSFSPCEDSRSSGR